MPTNDELIKQIDDLKTELNVIKDSIPNLKLNIQQINNDFVFISNLLKK
jgi:uncharacterized coiled-coil DUF342 family protein